jgi:hypothetical protein
MITPDQIRNSAKFGSPLRAEVLMEIADRLEKLEAAPKWVGLTDEELLELSKDAWGRNKLHLGRSDHTGFYIDFGRAVEAKLKEKNE